MISPITSARTSLLLAAQYLFAAAHTDDKKKRAELMMWADTHRRCAEMEWARIDAPADTPPEAATDLGYNRPRDYVPPITSAPGYDGRARVRDASVMDDPDT